VHYHSLLLLHSHGQQGLCVLAMNLLQLSLYSHQLVVQHSADMAKQLELSLSDGVRHRPVPLHLSSDLICLKVYCCTFFLSFFSTVICPLETPSTASRIGLCGERTLWPPRPRVDDDDETSALPLPPPPLLPWSARTWYGLATNLLQLSLYSHQSSSILQIWPNSWSFLCLMVSITVQSQCTCLLTLLLDMFYHCITPK